MTVGGLDTYAELAAEADRRGLVRIGFNCAVNAQPDMMRLDGEPSTGPEVFFHAEQGAEPEFTYGSTGPTFRHPRIRVNVRSTEPVDGLVVASSNALDLAGRLFGMFCSINNESIRSTETGTTGWYLSAVPESEPYRAGVDQRGREVFTFVVAVERQ